MSDDLPTMYCCECSSPMDPRNGIAILPHCFGIGEYACLSCGEADGNASYYGTDGEPICADGCSDTGVVIGANGYTDCNRFTTCQQDYAEVTA